MTDNNLNTVTNEFNIPMETPEEKPEPGFDETLKALQSIVGGPDDDAPEDDPADDPPGADDKPAEKPGASEIDAIMAKIEDEPESVQEAVRAALEAGKSAEQAVRELQSARQTEIDRSEALRAEENLVAEVTDLAEKFPGFTEKDLSATLLHLSKLPKPLAEALTLEEVAARALGRGTLEARRTAAPAPGGNATPAERTPDAATIIGDATPGPGSAPRAFDPGSGGDFMDIANHVTKNYGNTLVERASR